MLLIDKPQEGEYAPYAIVYINLVPDDQRVLQHLQDNFSVVQALVSYLSDEQLHYSYAPGKWTIKEVLVHMIDTERIFAYRALRIARNDKTPLPGFEENDYAPESKANNRDIVSIMEEYEAVRKATIALFNSFEVDMLTRTASVNGNAVSVRALANMIVGHELHHINVMKERYLSSVRVS